MRKLLSYLYSKYCEYNNILSELQIVEKQLNSVYMIDACVAKLSNYKNITNLKKKELTLLRVIVLKHRATI